MTRRSRLLVPLGTVLVAAALAVVVPACTSLQQFANLRQIRFDLVGVQTPSLAGVDLTRVRGYNDLSTPDILRLSSAVAQGELPLRMTLLVGAENPQENGVTARVLQLDYRLFLDDKETITGTVNDDIALTPGQEARIPVTAEVDLIRFFGNNTRQLVDLALAFSGQGTASTRVKLVARPVIQTPLGPIRYPSDITIVSREVTAQPR